MVTVEDKVTAGTIEATFTERHGLPVTAPAAILCGIGGVHSDKLSTSAFSLVREIGGELTPGSIGDTLSEAVIMEHAVNRQVLDGDDAEAGNNLPGLLMRKVTSPVGDALVDMRDDLAVLGPCRGAFGFFGHSPLSFSQRLLIGSKEPRVRDSVSGRESGEGCQPDINPHDLVAGRQVLIGNILAREGDKPLASMAFHHTGLDGAFDWPMDGSLHRSHHREVDATVFQGKPALRISEAVIPTLATKSRVTRLLASLHPAEESLHRQVYADSHILQHLAMDNCQSGTASLKRGKCFDLVVQRQGRFQFFIDHLAVFKKVVVQPSAFIKNVVHRSSLTSRWIQPILKSCLMHKYIVAQLPEGSKPDSSLALKCRVFSGVFINRR